MMNIILKNWHTMRWIRLAIAAFMIVQAVQYHELLFGFIAAFFLFQATFNTGCALNGCAVPTSKKQ
ncbi:hypothetical protein [Flavobacterium algicola]|uniref:hypothetical protein n=1 Tax=Flavobacterium algicola TaxID=556529 RepID=UPI001EFD3C5A|nr:hypothetical protein [Flavobacterium algicola]MCG9790909.1 hypothetical protein [Flavobacterium algicola]